MNQKLSYYDLTEKFILELPYKVEPYSKRNWGDRWHSLCSYQGKLKPAIGHLLVSYFTEIGDKVLDPMSGVGTIPLEATLQNRIGIGNDLNPLAYTVTNAKLSQPPKEDVLLALIELENYMEDNKNNFVDDIRYNNFGLNKNIPDYFHKDTYIELLTAREFFKEKQNVYTDEETVILSCLLHVLHGNRPYALSRNSHPLTPYAPTGEFQYKNVVQHIKNKLEIVYKTEKSESFNEGKAFLGDMFELPDKITEVDSIITSPPFYDSLKFYNTNWMRLWLAGWEPSQFKKVDESFMEKKQINSMDIYEDFFKMSHSILKKDGRLILHLGKSKKIDMSKELLKYSNKYFTVINKFDEESSQFEKHGITDKGSTTEHQFLFLEKK